MKNKKGAIEEFLAWLIIAMAILVVFAIAYLIISGKMTGAVEYIKNLLRFRRG